MKKLIITESQLDLLKTYLLTEAENPDNKMVDFVKQVKTSFINTISTTKIGNFVTFIFGNISKDGSLDKESYSIITLKIIQVNPDEVRLEFITDEGRSTPISSYEKGSNFALYPRGIVGFSFKNKVATIGFTPVDKDGNQGKNIFIPNFLSFIITDKNTRTNAIKAAEEANIKWEEENQKFNSAMNYTPAMLGMDNFFFFPKGYQSMDKTLAKFGLTAKDSRGSKITIRVKEKDGIEGDGEKLEFNAIYHGLMKDDRIVIYGKKIEFIFYIGNQKIGTGGDFIFNTSYKGEDQIETPITNNDGKSKINIVKS